MSVAHTYPSSETPLPQVAARAARQAFAAARPRTVIVAQTALRLLLTAAIVTGFAGLFAALIGHTLH